VLVPPTRSLSALPKGHPALYEKLVIPVAEYEVGAGVALHHAIAGIAVDVVIAAVTGITSSRWHAEDVASVSRCRWASPASLKVHRSPCRLHERSGVATTESFLPPNMMSLFAAGFVVAAVEEIGA
jgi:hypothetical protein